MSLSKIKESAKKFKVPLFTKGSKFPPYYATHEVSTAEVLNEEYLLCSDLVGKKRFSCEIDRYLGTTNYVFFSLGKGYLKTKGSIGLIYDPFVLVKTKGVSLVMNDLLHILGNTDILFDFYNGNVDKFFGIIAENYQELKTNKSKEEILRIFSHNLSLQKNLLVAGTKEEFLYGNIFELFLRHLPKKEEEELKRILFKKIVTPYTKLENLEEEIKQIFHNQRRFLSKFFDETKEEKIIELRIPNKHRITKGLIGVYYS